ncbi:threonine aldolase family protein [Echinicola pacifica]|nr:GntG family PLP-dependent aldolase [Echinicola pacifica]
MIIDLRSDTLTKPTAAMKEAMWSAAIGDDVFGEDPTVIALEEKLAKRFGMEAGLFCPSGTMTNQIAIKLHAGPHKEVICHKESHIYLYEGGGIMANSMSSVRLLEGEYGKISLADIQSAVQPDDVYAPETALVSLENTMNKGGGSIYTLADIEPISDWCRNNAIKLHLDGARIFNALVASGEAAEDWGPRFDTLSVCLSKGLGCPVGSVLLGDRQTIWRARKIRKAMGGGMRQAGLLAAAGIYALDHHIERLAEDHRRAEILAGYLGNLSGVRTVLPVRTNIVIAQLEPKVKPEMMIGKLKAIGILGVTFGEDSIRLVTHLDFGDEDLNRLREKLAGGL